VINAGVLLKGEMTVVTKDGEEYTFSAGDSIVEVVDTWHYGRNDSDQPAELVMFYIGTKGEPLTIKEDE
jgi:quercetin dioxygenase-like cupin family protein